MHLALVISSLGAGGAERVLSELANHWVSKVYQVSIVTLMPHEAQPFYSLHPKINVIRLNQSGSEEFWLKRFLNVVRRISRVRGAIHQLSPDVIISFIDSMNILTLIATRGYGIPVIISERIDPAFHVIPKLYSYLRLKLYPLCSKLIVQTESAAQYFPKNFKKFLHIVPNPVEDPKRYKKELKTKVQNIVSIGRLVPQKDQATLIYAFSSLVKQHSDLTLTIYGEGEERKNLENLIASLSLWGKVYLPGTTQDIQTALLTADVFVFPSRYEGFPNALCEAMSVGLPVIASNCSGNLAIVHDRDNGRLFPVGDIQVLTDIMEELLKDSEQRVRLAENARNICVRFHPSRIFAAWDKVIYDVLGSP